MKLDKIKIILIASVIALTPKVANAQLIGVSTELTSDLLMMPSLGLEVALGGKTTASLNGVVSNKVWGKDFKTFSLQPEIRYYFSGRAMHKHYFGIGGIVTDYDIHWSGKVYDGYALGAGLTLGYSYSINTRMNIDFHAGLGLYKFKRKEYFEGDDFDIYAKNRIQHANSNGYCMLPTRIGISLVYIFK